MDEVFAHCIKTNCSPESLETLAFSVGAAAINNDENRLEEIAVFIDRFLNRHRRSYPKFVLLRAMLHGAADEIRRRKLKEEHNALPELSKNILLILGNKCYTLDSLRCAAGCGVNEINAEVANLQRQKLVNVYRLSFRDEMLVTLSPGGRDALNNLQV